MSHYDWTETKVELWDAEDYSRYYSDRSYYEVTVQMIHREERDYESDVVSVSQSPVYIDVETGIMVHDVAAFEKWMAK